MDHHVTYVQVLQENVPLLATAMYKPIALHFATTAVARCLRMTYNPLVLISQRSVLGFAFLGEPKNQESVSVLELCTQP